MKAFSYIKAILSGFVWGLGQCLNKQFLKGLFFFLFFVVFLSIELGTGKYFTKTSSYDTVTYINDDKEIFDNPDMPGIWKNQVFKLYNSNDSKAEKSPQFDKYLIEIGENDFTYDNFIEFVSKDLKDRNFAQYVDLGYLNSYKNLHIYSKTPLIDNPYVSGVLDDSDKIQIETKGTYFSINTGNETNYQFKTYYKEVIKDEYHEVDFLTGEIIAKTIIEFNSNFTLVNYERESEGTLIKDSYYILNNDNSHYYKLYQENKLAEINPTTGLIIPNSLITSISSEYTKIVKTGDIGYQNGFAYIKLSLGESSKVMYLSSDLKFVNYSGIVNNSYEGPVYLINNKFFEYFVPGLTYNKTTLQYRDTIFTNTFRWILNKLANESAGVFSIDSKVTTGMAFRIYMELYPEVKMQFEKDFNNFFYVRAGLFLKSFWGIVTLGRTSTQELSEYSTLLKNVIVGKSGGINNTSIGMTEFFIVQGHTSRLIMLEALIGIILFLFLSIFMIWSIRDAYKVSEAKRLNNKILKEKEYFKSVYDNGFEYIVLSPALFVLAFITLMPILFGFLVAFTSMQGANAMGAKFSWVGFQNFQTFFNFSSNLGKLFGKAFWSVFSWTVIWAIFSTATCFFGGFIQALIVNNDSIVFRKFWRTILIIPWAMPALLSQMIFSVIFKDQGWVNNFLSSIGAYSFFQKLGILGVEYNNIDWLHKIFYLGNQNIQWLTNYNNVAFVKVVIIVINIWLGFPYFMALMTGIMTAIDKSLYEAADMDGATSWQKTRLITLPLVMYSTAPILIMTLSGNFNNFGVIYFITGGGPDANNLARGFAGSTDILISWMYKLTTENDKAFYNVASVFSILIFIIVGSVTAWNLSRTRAFKED